MSNIILSPEASGSENKLSSHENLIHLLYASLTDSHGFHPFLKTIKENYKAVASAITVIRKSSLRHEYIMHEGMSDEFLNWYVEEKIYEHDLTQYFIQRSPGLFESSTKISEDLTRQDISGRWQDDQSIGDAALMVGHKNEKFVWLFAIQRDVSAGKFSEEELIQLNRLTPFIQQALQLNILHGEKQPPSPSGLQTFINALPEATIVLNNQADVLYHNELANDLLESDGGIYLQDKRINLLNEQAYNDFFEASVASIRSSMGLREFSSHCIFIPRPDKSQLIARITPLENNQQLKGGALVTLYDPQQRALPQAQEISHYFGLTNAEAELCEGLVQGYSLKEISEHSNKTEATLRSYLKIIFEKTHQNRQGQLISSILAALMR